MTFDCAIIIFNGEISIIFGTQKLANNGLYALQTVETPQCPGGHPLFFGGKKEEIYGV